MTIKKITKKQSVVKKTKDHSKQIDIAIKKAKKEIKEAEEATDHAYEKVIVVAKSSKGVNRKKLVGVAGNLEKATHLAAESCESTEEAEYKFKETKKKKK